jgi:hypothetical protein
MRRDEQLCARTSSPTPFHVKRCRAVEATWHCEACGRTHEGIPFSLHITCPTPWTTASTRHPQSELLTEQCVIDGERFFLCALLILPVLDAEPDLEWSIWVEVAEDDFLSRCHRWFAQGREHDPPISAHLAVSLPGYADTLGIPGHLHTQPVGLKALFTLDDGIHPLARDQAAGIPTSRVHALAHASH